MFVVYANQYRLLKTCDAVRGRPDTFAQLIVMSCNVGTLVDVKTGNELRSTRTPTYGAVAIVIAEFTDCAFQVAVVTWTELQVAPVLTENDTAPLPASVSAWNSPQLTTAPGLKHWVMKYPVVVAERPTNEIVGGALVDAVVVKLDIYSQ